MTVDQLLSHRSGLGDFGNDFGDQLRTLVLADLDRRFTYPESTSPATGTPSTSVGSPAPPPSPSTPPGRAS